MSEGRKRRIPTPKTRAVLEHFRDHPEREWDGTELAGRTELATTTVSNILLRFAKDGVLEKTARTDSKVGGGPRQPYRVTDIGKLELVSLLGPPPEADESRQIEKTATTAEPGMFEVLEVLEVLQVSEVVTNDPEAGLIAVGVVRVRMAVRR